MPKCFVKHHQITRFRNRPRHSISSSTSSPWTPWESQGGLLAKLQQASTANRAGTDHIARQQFDCLRSAGDHVGEGPVNGLRVAAADFLVVDSGDHRQFVTAVGKPVGKFVRCDEVRPERGRKSFPLAGPSPTLISCRCTSTHSNRS